MRDSLNDLQPSNRLGSLLHIFKSCSHGFLHCIFSPRIWTSALHFGKTLCTMFLGSVVEGLHNFIASLSHENAVECASHVLAISVSCQPEDSTAGQRKTISLVLAFMWLCQPDQDAVLRGVGENNQHKSAFENIGKQIITAYIGRNVFVTTIGDRLWHTTCIINRPGAILQTLCHWLIN